MARFSEGDRVRLGAVRGGIVVRVNGKLRARFPDSGDRLLWLDYLVPDEGPDGRIYPDTWAGCERCGNPSPSAECINCRRRAEHAADAFDQRLTSAERRLDKVHVAGPVERAERRTFQRCERCGVELRGYIGSEDKAPVGMLAPGSLVVRDRFRNVVAAVDQRLQPTCEPAAVRRSA
jgi:hypothetical protein